MDEVKNAVYEQMNEERKRVAQELRAEGEADAERIRAEADRECTVILADANRDSQQIRGEGDAQAARPTRTPITRTRSSTRSTGASMPTNSPWVNRVTIYWYWIRITSFSAT